MNAHSRHPSFIAVIIIILLIVSGLACGKGTQVPGLPNNTATQKSRPEIPEETIKVPIPSPTEKPARVVPTEAPTQIPPTETLPPPTPVPARYLGETVEGYGYSLSAVAIDMNPKASMIYTPDASKHLIAVQIVVGNLSGETITVNPMYLKLIDKDGFLYESELAGADVQIPVFPIDKGERVKGWVAFSIPNNAVPAGFRYTLSEYPETLELQVGLEPPPANSPAPTPIPPIALDPNLPKLGGTVEGSGYTLTAIAVEDPAQPGRIYTPVAGTRLIAVEVVITNVSGETFSTSPMWGILIDSQGYLYPSDFFGRDEALASMELKQGEKLRGWISFTIPESVTPVAMKYQFLQVPSYTSVLLKTGLGK